MQKHELTDAEKSLLADLQREVAALQQQMQGALRLMLKQRGLEGQWALEGDALVEQK